MGVTKSAKIAPANKAPGDGSDAVENHTANNTALKLNFPIPSTVGAAENRLNKLIASHAWGAATISEPATKATPSDLPKKSPIATPKPIANHTVAANASANCWASCLLE